MRTTNEQKLVDICFECVLTALDHEHVEKFVKMTIAACSAPAASASTRRRLGNRVKAHAVLTQI